MTNSAIKRIAQKETRLFFASPVAWLFLSGFATVTLFIFFWGESFFARNIADVRPLFEWMPVLLVFLCSGPIALDRVLQRGIVCFQFFDLAQRFVVPGLPVVLSFTQAAAAAHGMH